MIAFPIVVGLIVGTAFLTALVSSMLPSMGYYWNAFKTRIKRIFMRKPSIDQHNLEVIVERMNELEEQINNVAQNNYRRENNRKSNVRREVRDYLKELADTQKEVK